MEFSPSSLISLFFISNLFSLVCLHPCCLIYQHRNMVLCRDQKNTCRQDGSQLLHNNHTGVARLQRSDHHGKAETIESSKLLEDMVFGQRQRVASHYTTSNESWENEELMMGKNTTRGCRKVHPSEECRAQRVRNAR